MNYHMGRRRRPGYSALREHRWSAAGANYFVTFKTERSASSLATSELFRALAQQRASLEADGIWKMRTWVVMPDHVHALFVLGDEMPLAGSLRSFKGPLSSDLRRAGLRWEPGFYEHRLREHDACFAVFRYIYLNPYRANLIAPTVPWPGYFCCPEDCAWFEPLTNSNLPFPEWLK